MTVIPEYEKKRQATQERLDSTKTANERNRLGQFATPHELAMDMLAYAEGLLPKTARVSFLDPGFGTGSFYSALMSIFPLSQIARATGFEIDSHYRDPAIDLWWGTSLELIGADFTRASPPTGEDEKYNLIICNPPYVRHHHIGNSDKARLQDLTERVFGARISGLAGLYCYFLGLSHLWMKEDGVAGWLIPSEFMDVNYGTSVKRYLLNQVTLLRIHRFDPLEVQFKDALVSSAVVWFRKTKPPEHHLVEFTFGGTLTKPKLSRMMPATVLMKDGKWTRFPLATERGARSEKPLGDFFVVRRGLATGDNNFFILSKDQIETLGLPMAVFRPVLPSPRFMKVDEIFADDQGNPLFRPQLFLLDCRLPPDTIRLRYPALWDYLESGRQAGVAERYLCKHRTPWYVQEDRPSSLFVCTYMGRGATDRKTPFRFILNHSRATVTNTYLVLYPRPAVGGALDTDPALVHSIWSALKEIDADAIRGEGRIYGGGLHKIEPQELANVPAGKIESLLRCAPSQRSGQQELFAQH